MRELKSHRQQQQGKPKKRQVSQPHRQAAGRLALEQQATSPVHSSSVTLGQLYLKVENGKEGPRVRLE